MLNYIIPHILRDLAIPADLKGYTHLRTAIKLCVKDESYLHAITKRLYPDVAKEHKDTATRVERSMRHAIEVCYGRCDEKILEHYIGHCTSPVTGKVTVSEFVACIAEFIRQRTVPDGTLLAQCDYRPCIVAGCKCTFHCWATVEGVVRGIVETANGEIHLVRYSNITFPESVFKGAKSLKELGRLCMD